MTVLGREFHELVILCLSPCPKAVVRGRSLFSRMSGPLVIGLMVSAGRICLSAVVKRSVKILNVMIRSCLCRLYSRVGSPSRRRRCEYERLRSCGMSLVARCCTLSSFRIFFLRWGFQTGEEYSRMGRTFVLYNFMKVSESRWRKVWLMTVRVLLAFAVMELMWAVKSSRLSIVSPRSFS